MRSLKLFILPLILSIFFAAALPAEEIEALNGRSLLKAIRELQGRFEKSAYETRKKQSEKASEKTEQAITAVEEKETVVTTAEPNKETAVTVTEKPAKLIEKAVAVPVTKAAVGISGDKILSMIPANSLFVIRINNLDYTLNQLDQFLAGASPMPLGLSMLIRTSLAQTLGSPDLKGVNMSGSPVIFALPPSAGAESEAKANPLFFVLLPIKDYKTFVSENANVKQPDSEGISEIAPQGKPVLLAKRVGSFILIAPREQKEVFVSIANDVTAGSKGLAGTLEADLAKAASSKPLWIYIDTQQRVSETLGATFYEQIKNVGMIGGGMIPVQTAIIDAEKNFRELRFISLSVQPKPEILNVTASVAAQAGTETAAKFSADSPAMEEFIGKTDANKPALAGDKMNKISAFIPAAENADFVGTYNLMKLFEASNAVRGISGQQTMPQAQSSLYFAIKFGRDNLTADIALPKEHLTEVMAAASQLSQPQLQQRPVEEPNSI
jgi:hypothetical protein